MAKGEHPLPATRSERRLEQGVVQGVNAPMAQPPRPETHPDPLKP